ncbi:MAG: preprotein translocase subunit Sec61beta [Candidatus Marsarchaeota archaeon]|jgi:Sec61beta family.|nr:preprotein translocase subunit Sec61beta [Candidatus Marsarchaeota archaeon]
MATLNQPQSQAGILSFYDAPERGPKFGAKSILIAVAAFTIIIMVLDHFIL